MDAAELRAMQAPIKERYKSDPSAAIITLKAKGSIDNEGMTCKVETGRALAVAGLHPATGGSGLELCSGDMLLEALVACAGVTLKSVATAVEVPLEERQGDRRRRSRFPRYARRRQGSPGRFCRNPAALRRRHRRAAGQARSVAQAHRALLRGLSDHQERPEGHGVDEAGVRHTPLSWRCVPGTLLEHRWRDRHPTQPLRMDPPSGTRKMSPELAFILTLALRMAITAAFVVTASVITERSGPVIGALVATLPISAGPSYVFLALDHDAAFIAEGALASLPINAATMLLGLTYAMLAQRLGMLLSALAAVAVWLALATIIRQFSGRCSAGLIVNAITFAICVPLLARYRHVKMPPIARRWYDIPLRASWSRRWWQPW